GGAKSILEAVDERPLLLARLGRHRAQRLQQRGHRAVAAERRHPHGFERCFVLGGRHGGEEFGLERAKVGHWSCSTAPAQRLGFEGVDEEPLCAAIHSSFTRPRQRAWISTSLISISGGLRTRPSRCLTAARWPGR